MVGRGTEAGRYPGRLRRRGWGWKHDESGRRKDKERVIADPVFELRIAIERLRAALYRHVVFAAQAWIERRSAFPNVPLPQRSSSMPWLRK